MRVDIERHRDDRLARRRLVDVQEWIAEGLSRVQLESGAERCLAIARLDRAAVLLESGVRGFLGRARARRARSMLRCVILVQRYARGLLGRRLATERRWQRASVVKSMGALRVMRKRSRVTARVGEWSELVDPVTNAAWYLNTETWRSTWARPVELRDQLVRRERAFAEKVAREKEFLLAFETQEEVWHAAFHVEDLAKTHPAARILDDGVCDTQTAASPNEEDASSGVSKLTCASRSCDPREGRRTLAKLAAHGRASRAGAKGAAAHGPTDVSRESARHPAARPAATGGVLQQPGKALGAALRRSRDSDDARPEPVLLTPRRLASLF